MNSPTGKIPAQMFAQRHLGELRPGTLLQFRGFWALRITKADDLDGFVMLEGEYAGRIFKIKPGLPQVLHVASPFGWFPTIAADAKPRVGGEERLRLSLTSAGPVIIGVDEGQWDNDYYAFDPTGQGSELSDRQGAMRFDQWSIELCHTGRAFESVATLLNLDLRHPAAE